MKDDLWVVEKVVMMVDCLVVSWAVLWVVVSVAEMANGRHIMQQNHARKQVKSKQVRVDSRMGVILCSFYAEEHTGGRGHHG